MLRSIEDEVFQIAGSRAPKDPELIFPKYTGQLENNQVIIRYLEKAIFALKQNDLTSWNFERDVEGGSVQFTFIAPLTGKKALSMVFTNRMNKSLGHSFPFM